MKHTNLYYSRQKFTNLMLIIFILFIGIFAAYTEFFQKSNDELNFQNIYTNPFSEIFLKTADYIEIQNRMGSFEIKKEDQLWNLINPKKLPGNKKQINLLMNALSKITIKKVYQKDKINIQNFSLNNPLVKLQLKSDINSISMDIGLINPINQSTYVSFSNIDKIFQINSLDFIFESVVLADIIDTSVFSFDISEIETLKIYRNDSREAFINLSHIGKIWSDDKKQILDPDLVQQFLTSIRALKSTVILDSISLESKELLDRAFSKPLYKIEIREIHKNSDILISNILYKTADLKIEKKQYIAIKASDKSHPILLSKDYLYLFNQSHYKLRKK